MKHIKQIENIINEYLQYLEDKSEEPSELDLYFLKLKVEDALIGKPPESIRRLKDFIELKMQPSKEGILQKRGISVQIIGNKLKITSN